MRYFVRIRMKPERRVEAAMCGLEKASFLREEKRGQTNLREDKYKATALAMERGKVQAAS